MRDKLQRDEQVSIRFSRSGRTFATNPGDIRLDNDETQVSVEKDVRTISITILLFSLTNDPPDPGSTGLREVGYRDALCITLLHTPPEFLLAYCYWDISSWSYGSPHAWPTSAWAEHTHLPNRVLGRVGNAQKCRWRCQITSVCTFDDAPSHPVWLSLSWTCKTLVRGYPN